MKFNLEISFLGDKCTRLNLDSTNYGYLSLLNDVCGAAIGNRTEWLKNVIKVEGVMPNTDVTIAIHSDEDIKSLIAMYLSLGLKNILVNLDIVTSFSKENIMVNCNMVDIHESDKLVDAIILVDNDAEKEDNVEVEERFVWSDSEFERDNIDYQCEVPDSNTDEDMDKLSDYDSDADQSLYHIDDILSLDDPAKALSDKIEGEYFEFEHDNDGNQIIMLKEGLIFDNVNHFKDILARYTIQEGINLKKLKNDKVRVTAMCNNNDCSWRIHASTYADGVTFKIKNIKGAHTCVRNLKSSGATASWIANEFQEEYKYNLEKSVEDLDSALRSKYGIHASSSKLFRARKIAMQTAMGDHETSYANIPRYIAAIKESNGGAFVKLKCDGLDINNQNCTPKFERIFISFEAQYQGYIKGCKPFIGVDGCFLKGPYRGEVLTAVTLDANSGIFPLAIMICEGESENSWKYFFDCLTSYMQDERVVTFMSDRQKGLKKAVKSVFPNLKQRFCARHLYANFRANFPGPKLRKLFWISVKAYLEQDFDDAMEKIKQTDPAAYTWLMEKCGEHVSTWARHGFDTTSKMDHVTNNMSESFNAFLGKMRKMPIITLLEWYRRKTMKRFFTRYNKALNWKTKLPPNVNAKVEKNQREGRKLLVMPASNFMFEVYDDRKYIVNFNDKTCQCREWQVCGVPCKHAMSCILYMRYDPTQFVDSYLTTEAYLRTYSGMINAISDESK